MNTHKSIENMELNFSNLSAEDLDNLDVEELEQRLELAAFDFTASVLNTQINPGRALCPSRRYWGC
jgi:hypothetical protein